jgi:uncharacterized protein YkvS
MGLESGPPTYISQLNSSNPTTSDDVAEGDDHLRMIKAVLKNQFSGLSGTTAISSSEAELNILDGVTSTAAELNILDGVTSTAAELNILDGVTSTAAELNIMDGVTSTAAELNILDGVTSTATELNYNDVTTLGTVETSKSVTADGSGVVNHADYQVVRPYFKDYAETVNAIGDTGGGSDAIDVSAGNVVTATVSSAEQTFTFTNPSATGRACSFTLHLTNGGSQTVNWPGAVDWIGGSAPTLTASGLDVLVFTTVDAGTTWLGFLAGADVS